MLFVHKIKIIIGPEICEKATKFPVGSSVLVHCYDRRDFLLYVLAWGCFPSFRLDLEGLAFSCFASGARQMA